MTLKTGVMTALILEIIFHNITVYCIFDQITAALVSIKDFFINSKYVTDFER